MAGVREQDGAPQVYLEHHLSAGLTVHSLAPAGLLSAPMLLQPWLAAYTSTLSFRAPSESELLL